MQNDFRICRMRQTGEGNRRTSQSVAGFNVSMYPPATSDSGVSCFSGELGRPRTLQDCGNRFCQYFEIKPKRPFIHILKIEKHPLIE